MWGFLLLNSRNSASTVISEVSRENIFVAHKEQFYKSILLYVRNKFIKELRTLMFFINEGKISSF